MNPYEAVATYLQSRGVGTFGTNIFIGHTPPDPNTLLVVFPTPAIYDPNGILHAYDKPTFQLYARALDFTVAYDLLRDAFNVLQAFGGEELSGIYFVEIVAMQNEVNYIGKDALNRAQLTQNYRAEVYSPTENRI